MLSDSLYTYASKITASYSSNGTVRRHLSRLWHKELQAETQGHA